MKEPIGTATYCTVFYADRAARAVLAGDGPVDKHWHAMSDAARAYFGGSTDFLCAVIAVIERRIAGTWNNID